MVYVRVAVPLPVHGLFTYAAPAVLLLGQEVVVPFGKRRVNGWVVETISAPDVPILTLAIPQSDPDAARNRSASRRSVVKIDDDRPAETALFSAIASFRSVKRIT